MRKTLLFLLIAAVAPALPGATVSGRVILIKKGTPLSDASNAVVWIENSREAGGVQRRGEMKSENKKFAPRVVVVSRGGEISFPNADAIYHNVFSISGGNRFDLGLYKSGASKSKTFEEAGLVRVYCNIHPQMVGFVMVVDSGFAALTGADGSFRFEGVPAGARTIKAWHEEAGETALPVAIRGASDAPVEIRLDVTNFKPQLHKNKYGKDYPPGAGTENERY